MSNFREVMCGPWICDLPDPVNFAKGAIHRCPGCGWSYRLSGPKKRRWWRNWYAENGHWRMVRP